MVCCLSSGVECRRSLATDAAGVQVVTLPYEQLCNRGHRRRGSPAVAPARMAGPVMDRTRICPPHYPHPPVGRV